MLHLIISCKKCFGKSFLAKRLHTISNSAIFPFTNIILLRYIIKLKVLFFLSQTLFLLEIYKLQ